MPPRVRSTGAMPPQVVARLSDGEHIYVTQPVIPQKRRSSIFLPSPHRRRYEAAASFKKSRQRTYPPKSSRRRQGPRQSTPRYYSRSDPQPESQSQSQSQSRLRTNWRPKLRTATATPQSAILVLSKFIIWLILWVRHEYDPLNAALIVLTSIVFEGLVYDSLQSSSYPKGFSARLVLVCQYAKHYLASNRCCGVPAWLILDVANHIVSVLSAFHRWNDLHTSALSIGPVMLVITPQALMRSLLYTSPQRIATGAAFWIQCFAVGYHYICNCIMCILLTIRSLLPAQLVSRRMRSWLVFPVTTGGYMFGCVRFVVASASRLYSDSLGKVYKFNQDEESCRWWERHEKSRIKGKGMLGDYLSDIDDESEMEEELEYPEISIMKSARWDEDYS
ncbi:hypothetical protein F5Y18DRAFT_203084 [Xylariaceae sp. FL1019]|nr:hypothetical protein F5Y18DRAFT_203084 [Xylariaceae sp. FL1019]